MQNTVYDKVFIPEFTYIDKHEVPGYKFIKTVTVGKKIGHILFGNDRYYLCVRNHDELISTEEHYGQPLGYSRKTLEELEAFVQEMNNRHFFKPKKNYYITTNKPDAKRAYIEREKFTRPPEFDDKLVWIERMKGQVMINVKTGKIIALDQVKATIMRFTKLSPHMINLIVYGGFKVRDWCLVAPRLDGREWECVKKKSPLHHKQSEDLLKLTFVDKNTNEVVQYQSIRKTAEELGVDREMLRKALVNKLPNIGDYSILSPQSSSLTV